MQQDLKINNPQDAYAILEGVESYLKSPQPLFFDVKFPQQKAFILDDSPRVGLKCTRRAGKSYGAGCKLYRAAFAEPGSACVYIGLTRATAKKIMWDPIMKVINRKMNLGCEFNESELKITLPNGSLIYITGSDANKDEMEKNLGGKLKLVLIDEAGSFRINLEKLCYEILEPALADYDGTIGMLGTPTDLLDSLFHKVTDGREKGWSFHEWNTFDNPYMEANWRKRLKMLHDTKPDVEKTPWYRRMYLGEWVVDLSALVYKFDEARNSIAELPKGEYEYVLGVDLGFDDASAFVVCAYSQVDRSLYVLDAYKSGKMIISDVAERIKYYQKLYDFNTIVIDNASKQAVEELKQRFGLPLEAADKHGKAEFIEILNSDLIMGMVKVLPNAEGLPTEWKSLIWDMDSKKREEHPACENHLSDAFLYAWRFCYQYLSEVVNKVSKSQEEEIEAWEEMESERVMSQRTLPFWERDAS